MTHALQRAMCRAPHTPATCAALRAGLRREFGAPSSERSDRRMRVSFTPQHEAFRHRASALAWVSSSLTQLRWHPRAVVVALISPP